MINTELTGHVYFGSKHETSNSCGNCDGACCDQCSSFDDAAWPSDIFIAVCNQLAKFANQLDVNKCEELLELSIEENLEFVFMDFNIMKMENLSVTEVADKMATILSEEAPVVYPMVSTEKNKSYFLVEYGNPSIIMED